MISIEQAHLPIAALTHAGMSGKNNEDSFGVSAYQTEDGSKTPVLLAVLSDGIGGHRAGEVASNLAVNRISQNVAESDGQQILETIRQAILEASEEIYAQAQEDPNRQGMGATCAVVCVAGNRLYTATVGDSRIYLMRGQNIRQISTDHTWIREALDAGLLTPDQVEGHPNAHVIRRYLGSPHAPEVDTRLVLHEGEDPEEGRTNQGMPLLEEDQLLLCSDGLSDLVSAEEILNVCQQYPLSDVPRALIDLANARGGHDNITVIILQMNADYAVRGPQRWKETAQRKTSLGISLLAAVGLAVVLGVVVGGWLLWRDRQGPEALFTPTVQGSMPADGTPMPGTPMPEEDLQTTPGEEPIVLPVEQDDGATLTPWPTHTVQSSATLPVVSTFTPVP